ncbi:hypothetical protein T439DRAFT_140262 [Meredithblackwellia eburnea MCA 4105]
MMMDHHPQGQSFFTTTTTTQQQEQEPTTFTDSSGVTRTFFPPPQQQLSIYPPSEGTVRVVRPGAAGGGDEGEGAKRMLVGLGGGRIGVMGGGWWEWTR